MMRAFGFNFFQDLWRRGPKGYAQKLLLCQETNKRDFTC